MLPVASCVWLQLRKSIERRIGVDKNEDRDMPLHPKVNQVRHKYVDYVTRIKNLQSFTKTKGKNMEGIQNVRFVIKYTENNS